MPAAAYQSRALLTEVEVFVAENNIRRAVGQWATNAQNAKNSMQDLSGILAPVAEAPDNEITVVCVEDSKQTVIRVSKPVDVTIGFDALTAITFQCTGLFVFTGKVASLKITNSSTSQVQVRVIQI